MGSIRRLFPGGRVEHKPRSAVVTSPGVRRGDHLLQVLDMEPA